MNTEISKVERWFKLNKLTLNARKSCSMLFHSKSRQANLTEPIIMDNCPIEMVTTVKFLGIELDSNLSWERHLYGLSKKCRNMSM